MVLFEEPTQQFSQKGVPLIVDVLPMLLELKLSMQAIHDSDTDDDLAHDITCIAAQAAILVIDKYTIFTEDCEIYYILIVICPDYKLQWFKSALGFMTQHVKKIKDMVVEHWKVSYASGGDESQLVDSEPVKGKKNQFKVMLKAAKINYPIDHILAYLDEPAIPSTDIQAAGRYMKWWYTSSSAWKSVTKMAMDYCSAPGVKAVAEMIGESESDEEDGS
ncbi:hypothetical protein D9756_006699 [Leucocoprinus leucothites]|uniref:Uncharacterized protein n=1 Tax=Leucocoprinus leucothites TaxID=201217 RepID=A0A8H5LGX3_9AGAR|nr:hypothetical protein D9756_006699 [Leucoagaricus leucothites]